MSAQTCTRCGAPLRHGVCPNGHPQRAARRRRRGRRWGRALLLLLLVLLIVLAGYAALAWYPRRVVAEEVGPTSEAFSQSLSAYREFLAAYPARSRPGAIERGSEAILQLADPTRQALGSGQGAIDDHRIPSLPVIGTRPPLSTASAVHEEMAAVFYPQALEVVGDLEAVSRYLSQIGPTLPKLGNIREELGNPRTPGEIDRAAAGATAVTSQLIADLRSVTPPEEMGPIHAGLLTTARAIRNDLDDIDRISRQGRSPVLRALIEDVESRIQSYRGTFTSAPGETRAAVLGPAISAVDRSVRRISEALVALREEYDVAGLTLPRD